MKLVMRSTWQARLRYEPSETSVYDCHRNTGTVHCFNHQKGGDDAENCLL